MVNFYSIISQDNVLSKYITTVNSIPMLDRETEESVAQKLFNHKCIKSAHLLVTSHLRLVVKIALKFSFCGLPIMDIISEGNIGLMHAVKKFNPYKGFRLSTYAIWWIKATIYEYILKSWSLVKIGTTTTQKKIFYNLTKIKQKIFNDNNNGGNAHKNLSQDDIITISKQIGTSANEVRNTINRLSNPDQSLNNFVNKNNDHEMLDLLEDDSKNQEESYIEKEILLYKKNLLNKAIETLNQREKEILYGRYLAQPSLTLKQFAEKYSISCERVRQIEQSVIKKIQSSIPKELLN